VGWEEDTLDVLKPSLPSCNRNATKLSKQELVGSICVLNDQQDCGYLNNLLRFVRWCSGAERHVALYSHRLLALWTLNYCKKIKLLATALVFPMRELAQRVANSRVSRFGC